MLEFYSACSAIENGNTSELLTLLTQHPNLIDQSSEDNLTLLHFAVRSRHAEGIQLLHLFNIRRALLKESLKILSQPEEGLTLFYTDRDNNTQKIKLDDYRMEKATQMYAFDLAVLAIKKHQKSELIHWLEASPELTTRYNDEGETLLHLAAKYDDHNGVELLINDHDMAVDIRTMRPKLHPDSKRYNKTPLHFAAFQCHHQTIKTLLTLKADPNATDGYGLPPLFETLSDTQMNEQYNEAFFDKHLQAITPLLDAGSKPELSSYHPLSVALLSGGSYHDGSWLPLIKLLAEHSDLSIVPEKISPRSSPLDALMASRRTFGDIGKRHQDIIKILLLSGPVNLNATTMRHHDIYLSLRHAFSKEELTALSKFAHESCSNYIQSALKAMTAKAATLDISTTSVKMSYLPQMDSRLNQEEADEPISKTMPNVEALSTLTH